MIWSVGIINIVCPFCDKISKNMHHDNCFNVSTVKGHQ